VLLNSSGNVLRVLLEILSEPLIDLILYRPLQLGFGYLQAVAEIDPDVLNEPIDLAFLWVSTVLFVLLELHFAHQILHFHLRVLEMGVLHFVELPPISFLNCLILSNRFQGEVVDGGVVSDELSRHIVLGFAIRGHGLEESLVELLVAFSFFRVYVPDGGEFFAGDYLRLLSTSRWLSLLYCLFDFRLQTRINELNSLSIHFCLLLASVQVSKISRKSVVEQLIGTVVVKTLHIPLLDKATFPFHYLGIYFNSFVFDVIFGRRVQHP
jgi:hypothetical protein